VKEAGERGLEREPEVGSGNLAVISAVDSIAGSDDLSFPLLESREGRRRAYPIHSRSTRWGGLPRHRLFACPRLSVNYICVGPVC